VCYTRFIDVAVQHETKYRACRRQEQDFFVALQQIRYRLLKPAFGGPERDGGPRAGAAESPAMSANPTRPTPDHRSSYRVFRSIPTRWADNDLYGHVNNVVYYSWFDTAVNAHLIEQGALDLHQGQVIGFVVETRCNYFAPLAFPETVEAGIRVAQAGTSSVRYEIGLFAQGAEHAAAQGHFVHVYVDRGTQRPVPLPPALQAVVQALRIG
jgi:acyl-CoA thioester hydrolase